jgi:hypothetical protein
MAQTQTNCPKCRQPVIVDIQQLFDLSEDPLAKQKLLANTFNFLQCPTCGYQGMLSVPVVYHDPEKELLLTFFPPDLNTPVNEQEKQIGPLINRILNNLPQEKRKAYLLQPKAMLTYQTLIENILEADGITKEMLEDQQKRIQLIQKLITAQPAERAEVIKREEEIFDIQFFSILTRIIQSSISEADEETRKKLLEIQQELFEKTETGKKLYSQAKETEGVIKSLQEASKEGLTREKLLKLVIETKSEAQISTLVSLARSGMDYAFFQLLSEKIEKTSEKEEKKSLTDLRQKLLDAIDVLDKQVNSEIEKSRSVLENILQSKDIQATAENSLNEVNDFFMHVLNEELASARKKGDLERINKLEQVLIVIEKATETPEEIEFIENLLETDNDEDLEKQIRENGEKITPELIQTVNQIATQIENKGEPSEISSRLKKIYKSILRYSMQKNLESE